MAPVVVDVSWKLQRTPTSLERHEQELDARACEGTHQTQKQAPSAAMDKHGPAASLQCTSSTDHASGRRGAVLRRSARTTNLLGADSAATASAGLASIVVMRNQESLARLLPQDTSSHAPQKKEQQQQQQRQQLSGVAAQGGQHIARETAIRVKPAPKQQCACEKYVKHAWLADKCKTCLHPLSCHTEFVTTSHDPQPAQTPLVTTMLSTIKQTAAANARQRAPTRGQGCATRTRRLACCCAATRCACLVR